MTREQLDKTISDLVFKEAKGAMVTGWVLSISVKHPDVVDGDGYVVEHSEGLPYHSQLGLLMAARNEKENVVLSQVIREG
jgi:hypothetical protein